MSGSSYGPLTWASLCLLTCSEPCAPIKAWVEVPCARKTCSPASFAHCHMRIQTPEPAWATKLQLWAWRSPLKRLWKSTQRPRAKSSSRQMWPRRFYFALTPSLGQAVSKPRSHCTGLRALCGRLPSCTCSPHPPRLCLLSTSHCWKLTPPHPGLDTAPAHPGHEPWTSKKSLTQLGTQDEAVLHGDQETESTCVWMCTCIHVLMCVYACVCSPVPLSLPIKPRGPNHRFHLGALI